MIDEADCRCLSLCVVWIAVVIIDADFYGIGFLSFNLWPLPLLVDLSFDCGTLG
jgi:hypothetical protein